MLLYGVCWIRDLILNVLNPLWLILLRIMVLSQCNFRQDRARRHVRDPRRARPVRARRAARGYRWKGNVKVEGCNDIFMQSQYAVGAYARPRIRADAAIASRFNRVEPPHGQEAFASASAVSPQLACRLAAPPGHECGPSPDTNRHEKLGVSTQGSGVRSWREELFSFPVPHSCSLRGRRIRGRA